MLIFIFGLMFAGFVSAFLIVKANAVEGLASAGQPRLPSRKLCSIPVHLSGVVLYLAHRALVAKSPQFQKRLIAAVLLGAAFVVLQGMEWVALIAQGLTLTSSLHGSFFYVIIGLHGLHALAAIAMLMRVLRKTRQGKLRDGQFFTAEAFWYFVVGIWPVLYWQVYL